VTNSENIKWEWSEKHTRLRFQLIVLALIFAGACSVGINKISIPGSTISFDNPPSDFVILILLGTFLSYTFISFVIRSNNERIDLGVFKSPVSSLLDEVSKIIEKSSSKSIDLDFSYLAQALREVPNNPQVELAQLEQALNSSLMQWKYLEEEDKNITAYREEILEVFDKINSALKPTLKLDQNGFGDKTQGDLTNELARSHYDFLSKWPQYSQRIKRNFRPEDIKESLQILKSVKSYLREIPVALLETEGKLKRAESIVADYKKEILSKEGMLHRFDESVVGLRQKLDQQNKQQKIEREWLGYKIPCAIALSLFIFGICHLIPMSFSR